MATDYDDSCQIFTPGTLATIAAGGAAGIATNMVTLKNMIRSFDTRKVTFFLATVDAGISCVGAAIAVVAVILIYLLSEKVTYVGPLIFLIKVKNTAHL